MTNKEHVLQTEFSDVFVERMKNRMVVSYYKYGAIADNYGRCKVDAILELKSRLQKYEQTGNTEWLIDLANFAMIEYMYPQHEEAHFRATDSHESPGLISKIG